MDIMGSVHIPSLWDVIDMILAQNHWMFGAYTRDKVRCDLFRALRYGVCRTINRKSFHHRVACRADTMDCALVTDRRK